MTCTANTAAKIRRAGALAVLLALPPLALPAPATADVAPTTSAACTNRFTVQITPGFSPKPSTGVLSTGGETGTISCNGRIAGHKVTGPGTFGVQAVYTNGTCLSHEASGTVTHTIPTTVGPIHNVGALTARRLGLVMRVEVVFPRARFSGVGLVLPAAGNCFVTPITQALVSLTGAVRG